MRRSHEVHTPNIKDLNLKYVVWGHFIPPSQILGFLTMVTSLDMVINIFEQGGPIKLAWRILDAVL